MTRFPVIRLPATWSDRQLTASSVNRGLCRFADDYKRRPVFRVGALGVA